MAKDWINRSNGLLAAQAKSFSDYINADPPAYLVSPAEAALLADECDAFIEAFHITSAPLTRTMVAVAERNVARKTLTKRMRELGARIRSNPLISDAAKVQLSLTVPGGATEARAGSPRTRPSVTVVSVIGNRVNVRLSDERSLCRYAKPADVAGAEVFYCVGDSPSTNPADWQHPVLTMSSKATLRLPQLPVGTKIWIAARWFSGRGRTGPISNTVSTYSTASTFTPRGLAA